MASPPRPGAEDQESHVPTGAAGGQATLSCGASG
jgi:hypothetical protein